MALPSAAELIAEVQRDGAGALDKYAPEVDQLADTATIAAYLGIQPRTIYRARTKDRVGSGAWPEPAPVPGRSKVWTWRTIILHRATLPGPGGYRPKMGTGK